MTDTTKLTDRETDQAIAEKVMGWRKDPYREIGHEDWWVDTRDCPQQSIRWSPSTDRNAAGKVLERIGELKLRYQFITQLIRMFDFKDSFDFTWGVINATPRQICIAALAAVEGAQ